MDGPIRGIYGSRTGRVNVKREWPFVQTSSPCWFPNKLPCLGFSSLCVQAASRPCGAPTVDKRFFSLSLSLSLCLINTTDIYNIYSYIEGPGVTGPAESGCPRIKGREEGRRREEENTRRGSDIRCIVDYHKTIFHFFFFRGFAENRPPILLRGDIKTRGTRNNNRVDRLVERDEGGERERGRGWRLIEGLLIGRLLIPVPG